jgi:hypothetical protein
VAVGDARLALEERYRRRVERLERADGNDGRAAALAAGCRVPCKVIRGFGVPLAPVPCVAAARPASGSKTVVPREGHPGFESLSVRHF